MRFEDMSWAKRSRLPGAMRYHMVWLGRLTGWVLLALLLGNVLVLGLGFAGADNVSVSDASASLSMAIALALCCALIAAGSRTRFLIRFGTPRLSVWLSNVLALMAGMALFLLGTLALNALSAAGVWALSKALPDRYALVSYHGAAPAGDALLGWLLAHGLCALPKQLMWLCEWTAIFYLLGCCLRRNKVVTLMVVIGVPLALAMLLLVPAVNETIAALETASEGQIMMMGLKWVQWLSKAARFIANQWQWIQLGAAVASLPLSYLCMRGTPQP